MTARVTVVCGVNWGDEGKGRMVDYLAENAGVVVRFQGGNNAGHTVVNQFGTFALHLVPSGIFYENCLNLLGPGMVIDLPVPLMVRVPSTTSTTVLPVPRTGADRSPVVRFSKYPV